jgi:hypothetical protein
MRGVFKLQIPVDVNNGFQGAFMVRWKFGCSFRSNQNQGGNRKIETEEHPTPTLAMRLCFLCIMSSVNVEFPILLSELGLEIDLTVLYTFIDRISAICPK